jgi:hypothetical protein
MRSRRTTLVQSAAALLLPTAKTAPAAEENIALYERKQQISTHIIL